MLQLERHSALHQKVMHTMIQFSCGLVWLINEAVEMQCNGPQAVWQASQRLLKACAASLTQAVKQPWSGHWVSAPTEEQMLVGSHSTGSFSLHTQCPAPDAASSGIPEAWKLHVP